MDNAQLLKYFLAFVAFGLGGIFMALVKGNFLPDYLFFFLSVFIVIFLSGQSLWLHKRMQAIRSDIGKMAVAMPLPDSPSPVSASGAFSPDASGVPASLPLYLEGLDIPHSPHMAAQGIDDPKPWLFETGTLLACLKNDTLEMLVQPVVSLPQKRVAFFQCIPSMAVEHGIRVNLAALAGKPRNLLSGKAIDKVILIKTLQFIQHCQAAHPTHIFICHLPATLYKDHQAVSEIYNFIHQSRFCVQNLVFEISLSVPAPALHYLSAHLQAGIRLLGKWQDKPLPENLEELSPAHLDFMAISYPGLRDWVKKKPRRLGLELLSQTLETVCPLIICNVSGEQEFHENLPLAFDYASGAAFGLPKPLPQMRL